MDSDTAAIARQTYLNGIGMVDEWSHAMPALGGEVIIRTVSARWHVGVTDEGDLTVRAMELPGEKTVRAIVKPDSANFLTIMSRAFG